MWAIDLAPFAYDEVDVLARSRAVLGGELTATGPLTSWGVPDPPMSVYLMVPPSALPRTGLAAAAWMAVLNVVAVVLTYILARRFFGPHVALAAGLLYALNPWAIYFSRRTWAEIVPLFTVAAFWASLAVICRSRTRWALLFFLALALQVQTRILALVYAPAALLTLVLFPRRWGLRWPLLGIALGVLVSLPYVGWVGLHWAELQARLAEGNRGVALPSASAAAGRGAVELMLWTAAGYGLLPATSAAAPWLDPLGQVMTGILWLVAALLVGGLVLALGAVVRRPPGWEPRVLCAIWLLPVGVLLTQSSAVYLHYMVTLFPAVFLVIALPLGALLAARRSMAVVGGILLLAICGVQIATTGMLYHILAAYDPGGSTPLELRQAAAALPREASDQLGTGERYGVEVPLRFWEVVADSAHAEAAEAGVAEVWVLAGATDPLIAERPAVLDYLLRPGLRPHYLATNTLVFPVGRRALILETPDVDPAEAVQRFGEQRAEIPFPSTNRAGNEPARLTLVPSRSADQWARFPSTRARVAFERGIELLGFRAPRSGTPGEELPIVTYWRMPADLVNVPLPIVLLSDQSGRRVSDVGAAEPPPATTGGERILVWRQQLAVPSRTPFGRYQVEVTIAEPGGRTVGRADRAGDSVPLATIGVSGR